MAPTKVAICTALTHYTNLLFFRLLPDLFIRQIVLFDRSWHFPPFYPFVEAIPIRSGPRVIHPPAPPAANWPECAGSRFPVPHIVPCPFYLQRFGCRRTCPLVRIYQANPLPAPA